MLVITGAAGFIGSHMVRALLDRGENKLLLVDLPQAAGWAHNLAGCPPLPTATPQQLGRRLADPGFCASLRGILHQGACTDTTERDVRLMMERNFTCSAELLRAAIEHSIPLVYASSAAVYGTSRDTAELPANEAPLNLYAISKLAFDQLVRAELPRATATLVGLRYFNVYGPHEAAKGPMASMVHQLRIQLEDRGVARLFMGNQGVEPGEQRRDFVFVDDVVEVALAFLLGPERQGIHNVGTASSRSFNTLARRAIELLGRGRITYIPFPDQLRGRYQTHTQADLGSLRAAGIEQVFRTLEQGTRETFRRSAAASEESPWTPA